jgi:acylphosphatase
VKTLRLFISGRVQGVWYRDWMVGEATARELAGWVRNRTDGRVEALVHGPAEAVDALVAARWRGPERARVEGVEAVADRAPAETVFRRMASV